MYGVNLRHGMQYWLPIMPGIAWLLADGIFRFIPLKCEKLVKGTAFLSVAALFLIQYFPMRTHGMAPTELESIHYPSIPGNPVDVLWMDGTPTYTDFINSSRFAWWGDVEVKYVKTEESIPLATKNTGFLIFWPGARSLRERELAEKKLVPLPRGSPK